MQLNALWHTQCRQYHLCAAGSIDKCHVFGVVIQDQAAQSVFHHETSHNQKRLHFAEAVRLIVALVQVVPAFACKRAKSQINQAVPSYAALLALKNQIPLHLDVQECNADTSVGHLHCTDSADCI